MAEYRILRPKATGPLTTNRVDRRHLN